VSERSRNPWPIGIVLVLAVVASFVPTLTNGFVNWDDDVNLTGNSAYRGFGWTQLRWMLTTTHGGHWQPLTWLSFACDHALWGMDARGYHLTNLALHVLCAILVWRILQTLLRRPGVASECSRPEVAVIGALLFAIHPLRVESVAWATERRDVLSGVFWLAALLAYLRTIDRGRDCVRNHGLAVAALALSLAAKAWGMTFPLVLLILDAWPLDRLRRAPRAVVREKAPYTLLAGMGALVALLAQREAPEMRSLAEHGTFGRVAQAAYGLCFYLAKTIVPVRLSPAYLLETPLDPTAPRYLAAIVAVVAITAAALLVRKRQPWWLATWAAYVVIVGPVLGFVQTGPQLVADRYTYLALLPWTALATAGLARVWCAAERPRLLATGSLATLVVLGVLTFRQTLVWHDSEHLWNHTLRLDPCNWVAFTNRGFARPQDPTAALADYSEAIRCNPRYALAYFDRGNLRHERGDYAGAAADFSSVIQLRPRHPDAWNNRGWARQALGDFTGAADDYERALSLAGPDWSARAMVVGNLAAARARMTANDR
jgi:hypothetical protein